MTFVFFDDPLLRDVLPKIFSFFLPAEDHLTEWFSMMLTCKRLYKVVHDFGYPQCISDGMPLLWSIMYDNVVALRKLLKVRNEM
jgi:hypothetical protein